MLATAVGVMVAAGHPTPLNAQTAAAPSVDIAAQALDQALLALARQANVDIAAPASLTNGRTSRAVRGAMSAERALNVMLEGTGLAARKTGAQSYTVVPMT